MWAVLNFWDFGTIGIKEPKVEALYDIVLPNLVTRSDFVLLRTHCFGYGLGIYIWDRG